MLARLEDRWERSRGSEADIQIGLKIIGWTIGTLIGIPLAIWAWAESSQCLQGAIFGAAGVLIALAFENYISEKRRRYKLIVKRALRRRTRTA